MGKDDRRSVGNFKCMYCGNTAPMMLVAEHWQAHTVSEDSRSPWGGFEYTYNRDWHILECAVCNEVSLGFMDWHDVEDPESAKYVIIYPDQLLPTGMPPKVARAFGEALSVKRSSANAFGLLLRRTLEIICLDKGAEGRTLYDKIKDLANKGVFPTTLADVATRLKDLGNVGAHPEIGELSPEEAPIIEDLTRAMIAYVYTAPYLADQATKSLFNTRQRDSV